MKAGTFCLYDANLMFPGTPVRLILRRGISLNATHHFNSVWM